MDIPNGDIFIFGLTLGALLVGGGMGVKTWCDNTLILGQQKLQIALGKDLLKIKEKLGIKDED